MDIEARMAALAEGDSNDEEIDGLREIIDELRERLEAAERERDEARTTKDMHKERYEQQSKIVLKRGKEIDRQARRAEAAEAQVAELVGALESMLAIGNSPDNKAAHKLKGIARNALAKVRE